MGFFYGFTGALLGAIAGGAAVVLGISVQSDGNDIGDAFAFIGLAPIGLVVGAILGIIAALVLRRYVSKTRESLSARRKSNFIVAVSVFAVPAFVTAALWISFRVSQPPSDQELLRNFDHNRATFNELAQMTQADKHLIRVDVEYDSTEPSNPETVGVSAERISKYRQLLKSVKLHRGFEANQSHQEVDFLYYATGSAISSDNDKGYAYLTAPPTKTLSSLDDCGPDGENRVEAYRHIEGCWYLYYDYLPG